MRANNHSSTNGAVAESPQRLNGKTPPPKKTKPLNFSTRRRKWVEAIIESLLALLDEADGDPDEEPSTDARGMWIGCGSQSRLIASGEADECEEDPSGYGDLDGMSVEEDGEPSLGWTHCEAPGVTPVTHKAMATT